MFTTSRVAALFAIVIVGFASTATLPTVANASPPSPPGDVLAADFAALQARIDGSVGLAFSPINRSTAPVVLGDWDSGSAWSTMKVPLVMAALRAPGAGGVTAEMDSAIKRSDNAAAEVIWAGLGDPATAAGTVTAVLRESGDPTVVQSERTRPEYSAFGQTRWSLNDQARFLAAAACDVRNAAVFDLMGQVEPGQRWGMGAIDGARFKGGWGPSEDDDYLIRQMALVPTPTGTTAVAVAANPASGSYDDGVAYVSEVGRWLTAHIEALPGGQCPT